MDIAKIFQATTYWPTYLLLKLFVKYEVEGQENLLWPEIKDGPIIFAPNHASYIDGPILAAAMPREEGEFYPTNFLPVRFLVYERFFRWKMFFVAWYVRLNGSIPIYRDGKKGNKKSLEKAVEVLEKNGKIVIFPEGKMTTDGELRRGRLGIMELHKDSGVPIVPVAIIGTYRLLPFHMFFRRKVKVKIGEPLWLIKEPSKEGVKRVMREIDKLLPK